jgi:sec-independent protein translocase protein TatB
MLSIPHLIIIFVVALVVFGPEKLPELARTLGKVMGEFRRATGDIRSTFEGHMRDLERETEQRSIGGGSKASAAPSTEPAAPTTRPPTEAEPPAMTAAEGTVAADSPHGGRGVTAPAGSAEGTLDGPSGESHAASGAASGEGSVATPEKKDDGGSGAA